MSTHKNRVRCTISNTPGGAGALTLSTADTGYRTLGAGDDGLSFDVVITDGTAWEVRTGCVYTHSGTSLARGTLEDSSTGSAITLTSAAVVTVAATADFGRRMESAALSHVTGADSNTTMVVGALYVVDGAALTADRTYTLPATAAVGDRIGVMMSAGSATYEVLLTAASGDTLNGVAGGTEWSRLFIIGEVVILRCVAANATWVVEQDGRIPQVGNMRLSTSADGEAANTFTRPTTCSTPGAWTADVNVGSVCTTASDRITARRAGRYNINYVGLIKDLLTDQNLHGAAVFHNGTANILHAATLYASGVSAQSSTGVILGYSLAADDYIVYQFRTQPGSLGLSASALPRITSGFSMVEVLP